MSGTDNANISKHLRRLRGTYLAAIPRDIIDIVASMLVYNTSTRVKLVSSNRLCAVGDFTRFLAIDHNYRRYIMYGKKTHEPKFIPEYYSYGVRIKSHIRPAMYDSKIYTISADGADIQQIVIPGSLYNPKWSVTGIKYNNLHDDSNTIMQLLPDGIKSESIAARYGRGHWIWEIRDYSNSSAKDIRFYISSRQPRSIVPLDGICIEANPWIVDQRYYACYIHLDGHSRRLLIVIDMYTGKRVLQAYGETARMVAKLQNYWVTLTDDAIARVYSDDRTADTIAPCAKKDLTQDSATRLCVGNDPNTFVVVQETFRKGNWFRLSRHDMWVSTYQVYEHIVFG